MGGMTPEEVDAWIDGPRGDERRQEEEQAARERFDLTVQALDRCAAAGAKADDLKWIASECGIDGYQPKGQA